MKNLKTFLAIFLALTLFACSGGGSDQDKDGNKQASDGDKMKKIEKLQKEVMKVHDKVMPKMEELQKLKQQAARMADSLEKQGDSAIAARMDKTEAALERGHESMMNWMRNYEQPADTLKAADAIDYLQGQKKEVKAMRDTMMGALKQARERLDSLGSK